MSISIRLLFAIVLADYALAAAVCKAAYIPSPDVLPAATPDASRAPYSPDHSVLSTALPTLSAAPYQSSVGAELPTSTPIPSPLASSSAPAASPIESPISNKGYKTVKYLNQTFKFPVEQAKFKYFAPPLYPKFVSILGPKADPNAPVPKKMMKRRSSVSRRQAPDPAVCAVLPAFFVDCGALETTENECLQKGCCWKPSAGNPSCWKPATDLCSAEPFPTTFVDCNETNAESCMAQGCCWRASAGNPTCWKPRSAVCAALPYPEQPDDCGNINTTAEQCLDLGCCWRPTAGKPSCWKKPDAVCANTPTPLAGTFEDCGEISTTAEQCAAKGCCWRPTPGNPSCWKPPAGQCANIPTPLAGTFITCGNVNTTPDQCTTLGCCWRPSDGNPSCWKPPAPECPVVEANKRVDCGNPLTTASSCVASGCCWSPLPAGTPGPYCYSKPTPANEKCSIAITGAERKDCGDPTTTPAQCVDKGCCWSPLPAGTPGPYCYDPEVNDDTCPLVPAAYRTDCGDPTTTAETCVGQGCCWGPLGVGEIGPWCYVNKPAPQIPESCSVVLRPELRVDCGVATTTLDECLAKGCCWGPHNKPGGFPVCYSAPVPVPPGPVPDPPAPTTENPGAFEMVGLAPVPGFHVALAPKTGKVVFIERLNGGLVDSTHTFEWDIQLKQFRDLDSLLTDAFCAAGVILPDASGRILTVGGWTGEGLEAVRLYRGCGTLGTFGTCQWLEASQDVAKIQKPRWYPSTLPLPNGRIAVAGGSTDFIPGGLNQSSVEILPLVPGAEPITLPLFLELPEENFYPIMFVLPNGLVYVMVRERSQLLDWQNDWETVFEYPIIPDGLSRTYPRAAGGVLLPLKPSSQYKAEVLVCGGGNEYVIDATPIDNCGRIELEPRNTAQWVLETMPTGPRVMPDIVHLPDGTVLIVNGAMKGAQGFNYATDPSLAALLYDPEKPVNQRFTILAASEIPRMYHSVALLLPDGRVLVAGSNPNANGNLPPEYVPYPSEYRVEYFSPPYLTGGAQRPMILTISSEDWDYSETVTITAQIPSGQAANVKAMLITDGFVTHSMHFGQRHVYLEVTATPINPAPNTFQLSVVSPPNNNICPPGWYLMFIADNGIPAEAVWVRVGGDPANTEEWAN